MDLVVGATGILGQQVVNALLAKGRKVRALVRETSDPGKVEALSSGGAEVVRGDLKDIATLIEACSGVANIITTASSTLSRAEGDDIESVDRIGHFNLVEAAEKAGVGHIVYVSFPPMEPPSPLQDAKRAVEARLRDSSVPHTILQPPHFWEVWCSAALGFDPENAKARIFGEGDGPINWVSMFDVVDGVVASLDNPKAVNKTFLLCGPETLTQNEIIKRFEAATGRTFERETIPLEALAQQHAAAEDPLEKSFAALMHLCGKGGWVFDTQPVLDALGIELRSIDSHIEQVVGAKKS